MTIPAPSTVEYDNFFSALMTADCTDTDSDIFIDNIPTGTSGVLVIDPYTPANREVILYTSKTSAKVTCPSDGRGYDNTTAKSHSIGTEVIMAPVAAFFRQIANGQFSDDPARVVMSPHYNDTGRAIVSGGVTSVAGTRVVTISDGACIYNGDYYTWTGLSATAPANQVSYIKLVLNTSTRAVTASASASAPASNEILLAKVTANAGAVTANAQYSVGTISGTDYPIYPIVRGADFPAWRAYTPTAANLTVGNGSLTGKYKRIGNTVHCHIRFVLGSTSVMSNTPTLSLPLPADPFTYLSLAGSREVLGIAEAVDNGSNAYPGVVAFDASSSVVQPSASNAAATYLTYAPYTATAPFTWGSGDFFTLTFTYECQN